jgi:DNA-binding CsgD family transcriptional regulator/PAS domain-containing protein
MERSGHSSWEAELERVNRALRVVSKTNKSLNQVDDVVTWLNHVCQTAVDSGGYRMACVGFAERNKQKIVRMVASAGFEAGYFKNITITWADEPRGRGPVGTAIRTGQPSIARNFPDDPTLDPWREEFTLRGYQSCIALPLVFGGRAFGVLGIYADVLDAFGPTEVEVLKEMADDLAFGLNVVLQTRAKRGDATLALEESQRKLAQAQRVGQIGYWDRDLKSIVIMWSDGLFHIFGIPPLPGGIPFAQFLQHVHIDDRPKISAIIENFVRTGQHYDVEFRIVRPDGNVRFVHAEGDVILDDTREPVRTFGIVQDVTERHQASEALENANRLLNEKNIALYEVLGSIAAEKRRIGRQITKNVQKIVLPLFHSLSPSLNRRQQRSLEQIQRAVEEIVSPFVDNISSAVESLTPRELRVCNFIKQGMAVKEIAEMEHLSPQTIAAHRRNIRRKLGIANHKINLTRHLQTVFLEASPPSA